MTYRGSSGLHILAVLFVLLAASPGCSSDQGLQGAFEGIMEEDQVENYEILYIQESESDGLVVSASWSADNPGRRDEPGIYYFQKEDGRWQIRPGTSCTQRGVSSLGLMGNGVLYCGVLKDDWDLSAIKVGNAEAMLLKTHGGKTAWFTRAAEMNLTVTGVNADGSEVQLN